MKKIYASLLILLSLSSAKLLAQCTATVTPFYENFEGITTSNQLPTCWTASNPSVTCLTFTNGGFSGNKYAAFYYTPSGSSYFYSNAIQLNTGVTYSASAWYKVSSNFGITWTDLSLFLGPNQNTTALLPVASTNGNVLNMTYSALSNTFTVASSGVYYIAMRGTSNGSGSGSQFLTWDDLSITVPCTPAFNTSNVTIAVNSNTVCTGSVITATASGANTYNWMSGATTPTFSDYAGGSNVLSVVGTNTLTGCSKTVSVQLIINPSPNVNLFANKTAICMGLSAGLTAQGASTYSWSNGQQGVMVTVSPTITTTYTVTGTNTFGCSSMATQQISVMPLPVITVTSSVSGTICAGEDVTVAAGGATSYQWNSQSGTLVGGAISFTANVSTTFTVVGTDANSCAGKTSYVLQVSSCTGLDKLSKAGLDPSIYPNPGNGYYIIESGNQELKSVLITDLLGKTVFATSGSNEQILINLHDLTNGIYNVKVSSASGIKYLRIVKE